MRLSHGDFDAFQRVTLELHECRDLHGFLRAAPDIFLKIVRAEYFGINDVAVDLAARRFQIVDYWESARRITPEFIERGERIGFNHPFTEYSLKTADLTALKFSDFYSSRQFKESSIYNEFYRHVQIDRLLGVAVMTARGMMTLNATRRANEPDFTERDRLIMNLLRPHFDLAMRNAACSSEHDSNGAMPLAEYGLSPREAEVATWLGEGKTNPEIATILGMQARTVEKHVERILVKLEVENRTAAALVIVRASSSTSRGAPGLPQLPDR